ncbi:hypothetical protein [Kineococcus sp. SYSU DK018]|uniref:hypothetical protein n=1 Tax=Kineococcus sp. SYSU DK018 TaxID=3383139 RepID=UPI003D7E7856
MASTVDGTQHTGLVPQFSTAKNGYAAAEVDDFVSYAQEMVWDLARRLESSEQARQLAESRAGAPGTPDVPQQAARLLELAQRSADTALAEARQQAATIVAEAEERALATEERAREAALALHVESRRRQEEAERAVAEIERTRTDAREQARELAGRLLALAEGRPAAPADGSTVIDLTGAEPAAPVDADGSAGGARPAPAAG